MEEMKHSLEELPADYARLLDAHAKLHGKLFNRMRLDLGGGADHQRTTEELLQAVDLRESQPGADREGVRRRPLQHHLQHRPAAADACRESGAGPTFPAGPATSPTTATSPRPSPHT